MLPIANGADTPLHARVVERLAAAGCVAADEEATELVVAASDPVALEALVRRRERGEPLAWITGSVLFCGRRVHVTPGVYVPRRQSEELARRAAARLPEHGRALDLCTGSGAVAAHLAAAAPLARVVGVEVDAWAAACARRNGVPVVVADLDAAVRPGAVFDLVTVVAPYVPTGALRHLARDVPRYEPRHALDGGADGLDVVRRAVAASARALRPGGWLLAELGGDQDTRLAPTLAARGFDDVDVWRDEDGDLRGLAARFAGS
ncbi:MAG TPA: methyltransferase domain-containing protein [Acidimicrobiia bacterium]|nr:methyltransferase domain-containing protein [Acidimicrobiia bacterium]